MFGVPWVDGPLVAEVFRRLLTNRPRSFARAE